MAKRPKTGGRGKGTPNKLTRETREAFKMLFDGLVPELDGWIRKTAKKSPGKAAAIVVDIAEHFIPKLSRQELVGEGGGPITVVIEKLPPEELKKPDPEEGV